MTANPLDQLLARAREAVRQADAAKQAKTRAKDGRAPQSAREVAQAEYTAWVEGQSWTLTGVARMTTRWVCRCGSASDGETVQFFAEYRHARQATAHRDVACKKGDHPSLPVHMRSLIRTTDYCVRCS